jgi:hypothetical protein
MVAPRVAQLVETPGIHYSTKVDFPRFQSLLRLEKIEYSRATLIGTPCVPPLEGPIIWKVPLTEKALFYVINDPAKTSVRPKPGPVIWKVPISKVPITVARLYPIFYIHVEPYIVGKLGYISQLLTRYYCNLSCTERVIFF